MTTVRSPWRSRSGAAAGGFATATRSTSATSGLASIALLSATRTLRIFDPWSLHSSVPYPHPQSRGWGYNIFEHADIRVCLGGFGWRGLGCNPPKKEMSWCRTLSSEGSEFDTAYLSIHTAVAWKARGTRVSMANANWNGSRWNRYRYSLDNDNVWNRENCLVVRNSRLSPTQPLPLTGVFFSR